MSFRSAGAVDEVLDGECARVEEDARGLGRDRRSDVKGGEGRDEAGGILERVLYQLWRGFMSVSLLQEA